MKPLTLNEEKQIMIAALIEIDDFCSKNDISYFLTGGTLLGAVRHGGFIPWDDDIDICFLRKDYERFVSSFSSKSGNISILNFKNCKRFIWPFSKAVDNRTLLIENGYHVNEMGVFIDLFPMDNVKGPLKECIKYQARIQRIKDCLTLKHLKVNKKRSLFKNATILLGKILYLIPDKCFIQRIEKMSVRFQNDECDYICNFSGAWGKREITKKEYFSSTIKHSFEGHLFPIPVGYDEYLKTVYGNYMVLPPVEKRVTHHTSKEFWRD